MKREVKFRVWSKHFNQWMNHCGAIDCYGRAVSLYVKKDESQITPMWKQFPDDDITIQQFTELKDKNGKEIYEGDIVKTIYSDENLIGEVIFHSETCMFRIKTKTSLLPVVTLRVKENQESNLIQVAEEVVGNIFENPEMIIETAAERSSLSRKPR